MSTKIKFKRGTTAAVNAYTPDLAEPVYDTEAKQVRIGDGSTLGGLLLNRSDYLYQVEKNAEQMRTICPSGFLPPHKNLDGYVGGVSETVNIFNTNTTWGATKPSIFTTSYTSYSATLLNKFSIGEGQPSLKICIDGYNITLSNHSNSYRYPLIVEMPTAPSTSTRQDMVTLEMWKEEVNPGASDDCFFPYGNVGYDPYAQSSTYDNCTLYSTTQPGGNWPLYLAGTYGNTSVDSSYHGKYVKANDTNISTFIANPVNNVGVTKDGKFFQVRWRISTLEDVYEPYASRQDTLWCYQDISHYFTLQGQKASRPAVATSVYDANGLAYPQIGLSLKESTNTDSGLYLGGLYINSTTPLSPVTGLSLDGFTYNIPLCLVHRRNSTAYSLANPNGAGARSTSISGRPDGKYYDYIHKDDVLDLRHRVNPAGFDVKSVHDETQQLLLQSELTSNWENLNYDEDGNGIYDNSNIYGTKILRSEGVMGTSVTNLTGSGSDLVTTLLTTNNNVPAKLDGLRNYFSDRPGEQVIMGYIEDTSDPLESPNPAGFFEFGTPATGNMWSLSKAQLSINIGSEGTYDTIHAYAPSVILDGSTYKMWYSGSNGSNYRIIYAEGPDGINWSNYQLSVDIGREGTYDVAHSYTPSVILDGSTYKMWYTGHSGSNYRIIYNEACYGIRLDSRYLNAAGPRSSLNANRPLLSARYPDVHWSDANNNSTYIGRGCKANVQWFTTGSYGLGSDVLYGEILEPTWSKFTISAATTLVVGDTYTVDGVVCTVKSWNTTKTTLWVTYTGSTVVDTTGASSAHTGTGDASITVTAISNGEANIDLNGDAISGSTSLTGSYVGEGQDLHNAKALMINAYVNFKAGSGFLTRVPYDDKTYVYPDGRQSIKASKFYIDGTQVLPNDGLDFHPFGTSLDPNNDTVGEVDTHCKSTSLMGFIKRGPVIDISSAYPYDTLDSAFPSIIFDGGTYKCWYIGYSQNIIYCESTNGVNWSSHQLVITIGDEGTYDTVNIVRTSIIKDSGTYKMWYSGTDGTNYRIIYCESTDGINWSNFQLSIDFGSEGTYDTYYSFYCSVIKDGSTYKMWYTGSNGAKYTIIYAEGPDGINWSNHQMIIDAGSEGTYDIIFSMIPTVIKDGTIYKCWYSGYSNIGYVLMYTTSTDGVNWIKPKLFMALYTEGYRDTTFNYLSSIIKVDATYKIWFTIGNPNSRIYHAILAMTDPNNTGSSTTGVYTTTGSMNFAPGVNDSVLIQYEHRALQQDWTRLSGADPNLTSTHIIKYINDNAMITSMGTGGKPGVTAYKYYRDYVADLIGNGSIVYYFTGKNIGLTKSTYVTSSDYLISGLESFMDNVPYAWFRYSLTENRNIPKINDYVSSASLDLSYDDGHSLYVFDLSYSLLGNNKATVEMIDIPAWKELSAIIEHNKGFVYVIACSADIVNYTDAALYYDIMINPVGRPIVK